MANRRMVIGIAAAATVAAGLAGCSSDKSSTTSPPATSGGQTPIGTKILVDGQPQSVAGQVTCTQVNGNLSIGIGDPTTGIGAVVTTADPPVVQAVGLGNLGGATLGYSAGAPNQGNALATKSGNSYTIKGTATGVNAANVQQTVSKSFEIDATCP